MIIKYLALSMSNKVFFSAHNREIYNFPDKRKKNVKKRITEWHNVCKILFHIHYLKIETCICIHNTKSEKNTLYPFLGNFNRDVKCEFFFENRKK